MKSAFSLVAALGAGTLFSATGAFAQFTQPNCDTLKSTDFTRTSLFMRSAAPAGAPVEQTGTIVSNLTEPVAMAFNAVKTGDSIIGADIYFVQRKGSLRKYDFAAKTVKEIGFVSTGESSPVTGSGDNGLMGIALDPAFAANRWVYLWYIPPRVGQNNYRGRLSRFTLGANDTLQLTTEKNLLDIKLSKTRTWHSGGPMRFDAHGDLWLTIGNNATDLNTAGRQFAVNDSSDNQEWGASNTASMRGGVVRIHPDTSAKGYSIPAGNFGEYWANHYQTNNNASLAAQYRDTAKVLPEIYVKGTRSNYSIWVHPTKRWLAWGEVNYEGTNDEYNLVTRPEFTGFPYFHKNNQVTPGGLSPAKDVMAPTNVSPWNSGVQQLPPVKGPALWYGGSVSSTTLPTNVAIGGDVYLYDPRLKSKVKFPPHFHHVWLMMQSTSGSPSLYGVKIDSLTVTPTGNPARLDNGVLAVATAPNNIRRPVQASYGPDGALYVLNYGGGDYDANGNSGILRVTYNGSCHIQPASIAPAARALSELRMTLNAGRLQILEQGAHEVSLLTAGGRELFRSTGSTGAVYDLAKIQGARGVTVLRVKTDKGVYARSLPLF